MDKLVEIASRCKENTIENFVTNIEDMEILCSRFSPAIEKLFENSFIETDQTTLVTSCNWDS